MKGSMTCRGMRRLLAWTMVAVTALGTMAPAWAKFPRSPVTTQAEQAFWWGDFAALDKQNDFLRHGKHATADDGSELELFRMGIDSVIGAQVAHREPYLQELEAQTLQWATENPKSALAHILYAKVLVAHAWSYRGGGYAKDVPPEAWKDFRAYLQRAADYLNAHGDVAFTDSYAYSVMITIGMGMGVDAKQLEVFVDEGIKRNPYDYTLYFDMLTPLMPKWGGDARTLDDYIRKVAMQTRAEYGMGWYARLYGDAADDDYGHELFQNSYADWPTMKQGYEDMMARYPDSPYRLNVYGHMACLAKDKATLQAVLAKLGNKLDASWWGPNGERSLEVCQRWAKEQ
jgi:hypothetical protein